MGSLTVAALEIEVLRNPSCIKTWFQLIHSIQTSEYESREAKANAINIAYERAIRANSFSYKLWINYITYRQDQTKDFSSIHEWFRALRDIYDRAVEKLPMMPLLWISYIEFILNYAVPPRITLTRHTIIKALKSLPITQHHRIWKITKQWCNRTYVPIETAKYLWKLHLLFDTKAENQRNYFNMLWEKGTTNEFLIECVEFLLSGTLHNNLLGDMSFWEIIRVALETKDLNYSGDFDKIDKIINIAVKYCASSAEFKISYAVFLAGQGEFSKSREILWNILEDADDITIFIKVFNISVAFEDQIIDSFAMDSSIQSLDDKKYYSVIKKLFGNTNNPFYHLLRLTNHYSLLINQIQLREDRNNTAFWLKRIELLQEMVYDKRASQNDVIALYRQAISQCTSGIEIINMDVAQLFESFACYLWENGLKDDAITVLKDGTWYIKFSSSTSNILLMGLFVEFKLLLNSKDFLNDFILKLQGTNISKTIRSKGLFKNIIVPNLQKDSRAWILIFDTLFYYSLKDLDRFLDFYTNSLAYTAESICYIAGRLWYNGNLNQTFREFEKALVLFKEKPLSILYILQQYLSCLCISFGKNLPLHRLRELTQMGFEVTRTTMKISPINSVEYLMNCTALESQLGLSGTAVNIAQECLHLALMHINDNPYILLGILDNVLDITFKFQGSQVLRQYCIKLLEYQHLTSPFIQRVALWWAAVEKRTGNIDKAHTVMEACCKSQDPSTSHGSVFWNLWESICTTVTQFEGVNRRKQQVTLKYGNNSVSSELVTEATGK